MSPVMDLLIHKKIIGSATPRIPHLFSKPHPTFPKPIAFEPTIVHQLPQHFKAIVRFGPKGAKPRVVRTFHAVIPEQWLKIEGEPVRRERHGVITIRIERLLRLGLVGGLRESVYKVIVGIEGGVVVPDGRHDGYAAIVRGIVGAGYTC